MTHWIEEKYIDSEKYQEFLKKQKKNNMSLRRSSIVFFLIFIFFFFKNINIVNDFKIYTDGHQVLGKVEHKFKGRSVGLYNKFSATVSYELNGIQFREEIKLTAKEWLNITKNAPVKLYYHPNALKRVQVSNTFTAFFMKILFMILIMNLLVIIVGIFFRRLSLKKNR